MSSLLALLPLAEKAIGRLFPDPAEANKAKLELLRLQQEGNTAELEAYVKLLLGQMEINKTEAQSQHLFVAGWRPFVGWVCGSALAWNFIVYPTVTWAGVDAPMIEIGPLMTILAGMLGLGAMRSFDKIKGVATTHIK